MRMLKKGIYKRLTIACFGLLASAAAWAQGMHFSQYYNAPLLLNPANTALMPANDYRLGMNFRNQWATVPVPYRTISLFGDLQAFRNMNGSNWLGVGFAFFNDVAGNGDLGLSRIEGFLAYHVQMGETSMLSVGGSIASVNRTVNFNKLTFNRQWNGLSIDPTQDSGEPNKGIIRTKFTDIGAGINLAVFPNELAYMKFGVGVAHINQPVESFYNTKNQLGIRPTVNFDGLFQLNETIILNPSLYYTTQKKAYEALYGTLLMFNLGGGGGRNSFGGENKNTGTQLIVGAYHRWNEAIVATFGLQWSGVRLMTSYDYTVSKLSEANNSNGAIEFALIYEGVYGTISRSRKTYNCPRF